MAMEIQLVFHQTKDSLVAKKAYFEIGKLF